MKDHSLQKKHKGAQNPSYFGDPDLDTFHEWQEASGGLIKKIALAPERKGVKEFVKTVTDEGVVVSLGTQMRHWKKLKKPLKLEQAYLFMLIMGCAA